MPPELPRTLRRILVLRLDNIGDVIMLSPALQALRARFPAARITLMASPAGALVAPLLPWIDEVFVHRAVWQDASGNRVFDPAGEQTFIAMLAARRYDAAIIFTSFSQSPFAAAYACYLAGIPIRAGHAPDFGGAALSHAVPSCDRDIHQSERNIHLLEALGVPATSRAITLVVPGEAYVQVAALLSEARLDASYFVLAPGASCSARRYDPARFAEAARLLVEAFGRTVVLIGTARDGERAGALAALTGPGILSLFGRTNLAETAALIARACLVICNNSAPLHLADAFARPCVVLYGGTDLESQWRPRRSRVQLLRQPTACTPCYRFTCPHGDACLDLPPSAIVDAAAALITPQLSRVARG